MPIAAGVRVHDSKCVQGLCTSSSYSGFRVLLEETPEFPAALSQALQQLAHYSSRVRTILVSNPVDFRVAAEACNECIVRPPPASPFPRPPLITPITSVPVCGPLSKPCSQQMPPAGAAR